MHVKFLKDPTNDSLDGFSTAVTAFPQEELTILPNEDSIDITGNSNQGKLKDDPR